jgi:hypothetical protein
MIEADDVRLQVKAEWRRDADAAEKAGKIQKAREVTEAQLALIDNKMAKMAEMRQTLAERLEKYNSLLRQWTGQA